MKKLSFVLAIVFSVFFLQSCMKDQIIDNNEYKTAPELPSLKTIEMPFGDFSAEKQREIGLRTVNNFSYSLGNVLIWNSLLSMHLTIPILALTEAFNHEAEYQGNGIWLWAYSLTDDKGDSYEVNLFGEMLSTEEFKWDMYVSKVGGFQDVHWVTGLTANDESYARWTLNFDIENPKPFIQIDFTKKNSAGVSVIRYTNKVPGDAGNGGYIEYREGSGAADIFNRAYDVYKIEKDNLLEINWDESGKNGRVKDIERYNDGKWHCWDNEYQDVDC